MSNSISTDHLDRRFGEIHAVVDLTLEVESGVVFGLLGANGAGKTTVIKMLTTLLPPTSGRAVVAGFDVVKDAARVRRAIGYVPQMLSADGTLTGYENLLIFAKLYDIPRQTRRHRIAEALTLMGLERVADRLVREYSGGMIRRLEIAQSMLHRPDILFLDEPTIGLDPIARSTVWDHVKSLRAQFGTTILMTTHLMDEADAFCERIAIMHRGRVAIVGEPAALKASVGAAATMDDVFVRYAGVEGDVSERFRDISRERHTAQRLG
jgi:ABC-2 type transport system ATP-binding protein